VLVWSSRECDQRRTLHGNNVATLTLDHLRDHVVNQTVLVPDLGRLKFLPVLCLVNLLEDVLEPSVIGLQDGVLGAHVQRQLLVERKFKRRVCKAANRLGGVVLGLGDTALGGEVVDLDDLGLAALGSEDHLQCALAVDDTILGAVLVAECVAADDDRLLPAGDEAGNGGDNDGGTEDGSSAVPVLAFPRDLSLQGSLQVVTDGTVGRQPHLLELELLDALLVGCDGRALDTDRVLLDGLGGIERDLVVRLIAVGQAEIVVLEVDVEVRVDELWT
jgi:hypothetical protein